MGREAVLTCVVSKLSISECGKWKGSAVYVVCRRKFRGRSERGRDGRGMSHYERTFKGVSEEKI